MSPWLLGFVTIVVTILIYRLLKFITGHSLPLPPGPSPWPIVGNLPHMGRAPHQTLAALAHKYGPLMHLRLGFVDVVVVASAAVAEQFLKVHDAKFLSRPLSFMNKYMSYYKEDFGFAPYGPRWRLLRKISSTHMFSGRAMDEFREVRQEELERLICKLASSDSRAVKLGQLLNVCVTNTLTMMMMGQRVFNDGNNDWDPKADEFKSIVLKLMNLSGVFNIGDYIPFLAWLDLQGLKAEAKKLRKRFDAFFSTVLEEHRISKNEKHQNFYLTTLLSLKETPQEGYKLSEDEIKAILVNMFGAGTDTTSSTIEWTMAELIRNPRCMVEVQEEIDNVVGRDRLVSELDLPQLPYLQAVVKETFRLHPPTPLSIPRYAEKSFETSGYHIPKGATLLVNVWAIGRDPNEWSDPLVFKPERFLLGGEKAGVDVRGNNFEVIPFGAGRRICAGMSLGLTQVQLLTATLAHAFDWELENGLDPKCLNMDEAYGLTLQRQLPLCVHPRPRLSHHLYSSSSP